MKKINKLIYLTFSATLLFTSCESMLDEDPKYTTNEQTLFNQIAGAESVLDQCYGHVASIYGQSLSELTIADGVTWAKTDAGQKERFVTFDAYAEDDRALSNVWRRLFKVVAESNYFISSLEKSGLSDEYKEYGIAQARFLRGFAYYKLTNLYGKTIVFTQALDIDNLHSPLNTQEEVYKQIIEDFTYAEEHLNENIEEKVGRASKQTVQAYLAKFYWLLGSREQGEGKDGTEMFKKAKKYGDMVINSGKYSLATDYSALFGPHVGNSQESIFQVNFSLANGVQNRSNFNFAPSNYATSGAKSWGNIRMDRAFYNYFKGTYPDDPRLEATFLTKYRNVSKGTFSYTYPFKEYTDWSSGQKEVIIYNVADTPMLNSDPKNPQYDVSKMPEKVKSWYESKNRWDENRWPFNKKMADINTSPSQFDTKNMMIFRYADLLLLMADVENELGNSAKAVEYVNMVLTRARQSGGANATYPMNISSGISKSDLRDKIFFERMFEMAGETELFEDIRRRGTEYLKKVISIHNDSYSIKFRVDFQNENEMKSGAFRDYLINEGNLTEDFLKKNLLLPIPSKEINYNDKVTQADQNFGY